MRPNEQRGKAAIVFLWLSLGIELISGFSDYLQYTLLQDIRSGTQLNGEAIQANDIRQQLIAIAAFLIYIGTAITFIMWFRRAYYNLHQALTHLSFSEGWAAGAWFVPFLNLGRPYVIMKEMVYETQQLLVKESLIGQEKSRGRIVGTWWTFWIITSIVSNSSVRIQLKSSSMDVLIATTGVNIFVSLLCIPLTIITVRMVKQYMAMEALLPLVQQQGRGIRLDNSELLDSI